MLLSGLPPALRPPLPKAIRIALSLVLLVGLALQGLMPVLRARVEHDNVALREEALAWRHRVEVLERDAFMPRDGGAPGVDAARIELADVLQTLRHRFTDTIRGFEVEAWHLEGAHDAPSFLALRVRLSLAGTDAPAVLAVVDALETGLAPRFTELRGCDLERRRAGLEAGCVLDVYVETLS